MVILIWFATINTNPCIFLRTIVGGFGGRYGLDFWLRFCVSHINGIMKCMPHSYCALQLDIALVNRRYNVVEGKDSAVKCVRRTSSCIGGCLGGMLEWNIRLAWRITHCGVGISTGNVERSRQWWRKKVWSRDEWLSEVLIGIWWRFWPAQIWTNRQLKPELKRRS